MKSETVFKAGQELPVYKLVAYNYAPDSENRIHGDEIAKQFGFKGGLVPGVGDFAYMTHPVVEALGVVWLEKGWMDAKFLKPVYDGDTIEVRTKVGERDGTAHDIYVEVELYNSEGTLCATGSGGRFPIELMISAHDFPLAPLPDKNKKLPAHIDALPAGMLLGSISQRIDLKKMEHTAAERYRDELPYYKSRPGHDPAVHPGILLQMANDILVENVALGPWIHTASEIQNHAIPRDGEELSLRGRVRDSYERRGHHMVELDLAMFGEGERPIMKIEHKAIIRLREA